MRTLFVPFGSFHSRYGLLLYLTLTVLSYLRTNNSLSSFTPRAQCEDYGQVAIYKGTIPGAGHSFSLDSGHTFITGKVGGLFVLPVFAVLIATD